MALLNPKIKLFICAQALALLFVCSSESAFAKKKIPRFKDYPVAEVYKGKNARLSLPPDDSKVDRARLQWALDNLKVNFAGHYIVTTWSCGTWCIGRAVIDAKTGKVSWGTDVTLSTCWEGCNEKGEAIEHRVNSKLIIFYGRRKDNDGDNGAHYYKFENRRFVHLRSILRKEQRRAICVFTKLCG